jgi:branched-chain amino acid transport system ATP-binding protein
MAMLEVNNIHTYYGDSYVLQGISLRVAAGQVVAVLGRNGVGKTTLVRSIIGFAPPRLGRVTFKGEEIAGRAPQRIARLGIGLVPQGRRMFPSLTTRETLEVGRIVNRWDKKGRGWTIEQAFAEFPRLSERADQLTGRLSGGEQQMAATARALVGYPDLLLLDEPTEGLAPLLVEQMEATIRRLKQEGIAILLVEQRVPAALRLADTVIVMSKGRVVFRGTPDQLRVDRETRERYLGL